MLTLADWVIVFLSYLLCAGCIAIAVYYYRPGEKKRWPFAYIIVPAMLVHGLVPGHQRNADAGAGTMLTPGRSGPILLA